jgi:hypothetical protein
MTLAVELPNDIDDELIKELTVEFPTVKAESVMIVLTVELPTDNVVATNELALRTPLPDVEILVLTVELPIVMVFATVKLTTDSILLTLKVDMFSLYYFVTSGVIDTIPS